MAITEAVANREAPAFDVFVTALKNAHALEQQALQIMRRQIDRLENYPELLEALKRHTEETEEQRQRIARVLEAYGESPSTLKEGVLGIMGNLAALGHAPAEDEILKNTFANHAFENYEIAAYESLILTAKEAGHADTAPFEATLQEEERMAKDMRALVKVNTRRYLTLQAGGAKASR